MNQPLAHLPLRQRLRALTVFPEMFPAFEAGEQGWPQDPVEAFLAWLDAAAEHRVVEPHVAVLATADAEGAVSSRALILKDIVEEGWVFASQVSTRKVADLRSNPRASMTFYWPELGRQICLDGVVTELGADVAAEDYRQRPLAGTEVDPGWKAFALNPLRVEFWQASTDRAHQHFVYERSSLAEPFAARGVVRDSDFPAPLV